MKFPLPPQYTHLHTAATSFSERHMREEWRKANTEREIKEGKQTAREQGKEEWRDTEHKNSDGGREIVGQQTVGASNRQSSSIITLNAAFNFVCQ